MLEGRPKSPDRSPRSLKGLVAYLCHSWVALYMFMGTKTQQGMNMQIFNTIPTMN